MHTYAVSQGSQKDIYIKQFWMLGINYYIDLLLLCKTCSGFAVTGWAETEQDVLNFTWNSAHIKQCLFFPWLSQIAVLACAICLASHFTFPPAFPLELITLQCKTLILLFLSALNGVAVFLDEYVSFALIHCIRNCLTCFRSILHFHGNGMGWGWREIMICRVKNSTCFHQFYLLAAIRFDKIQYCIHRSAITSKHRFPLCHQNRYNLSMHETSVLWFLAPRH